ncbi:MAG TPA: ROK family protein [Burkholderiaceae bacterium]|nr:ROK family protein [Burkholderiaceae bacterium]
MSQRAEIAEMEPLYIGALDIGGTKIAATMASAQGPLVRLTQPTVKAGTSRALPEQGVALLEAACAQAGIDRRLLNTVGVSSCGPFARIDGALGLAAPNLCGARAGRSDLPNDWDVIPLEKVLREQFQTIVIENDCVAALVAERTFGAARDEPDCVYVTWSTGIGFGLCVDGRILRGKQGNAGHAGHMLMSDQSAALCGCGNRGDLEALISGRGLGTRLAQSVPALFAAARNGEPAAYAAVEEAARWFGRALYNIAAILDTRVFVIGGSVWAHHGDLLAPLVRPEIETRLPALTHGVSLVPAELGTLVADIGALGLVMPASWTPRWRDTEPWRSLGR